MFSNVFNPRILEAGIRDVASLLPDNGKADVLLYAAEKLHFEQEGSRSLIENVVKSCLLLGNLSTSSAVRARLLRAKSRIAAGTRVGAQSDLQAILMIEPEHSEAKSLLVSQIPDRGPKPENKSHISPAFSTEIWWRIALFLPRWDLRTLLFVPGVLSRIASGLLFQRIDLHFSSDDWTSRRSADILTRIILDPKFAIHIQSLRIFSQTREYGKHLAFQTGMISNALPKMANLRSMHCTTGWNDLKAILRSLHIYNPRIQNLSLESTDGMDKFDFPNFSHLKNFAYISNGVGTSQVEGFLSKARCSLRTLHIHNLKWTYPAEVIAVRNLSHLDIRGSFGDDSFAQILSNGHQLEWLRLECHLNSNPSPQFRDQTKCLPFLRHFSLLFLNADDHVNDPDLFPAVNEVLRGRHKLRTLHLAVCSDELRARLGFNATVWAVLPSLTSLRELEITLPQDVAPSLATWLIPRTVTALYLHPVGFHMNRNIVLAQLRLGIPPTLDIFGLSGFPRALYDETVQAGFPTVKILRLGNYYYTVLRTNDHGVERFELEEWPKSRVIYHRKEWLEFFGCEDLAWKEPRDMV